MFTKASFQIETDDNYVVKKSKKTSFDKETQSKSTMYRNSPCRRCKHKRAFYLVLYFIFYTFVILFNNFIAFLKAIFKGTLNHSTFLAEWIRKFIDGWGQWLAALIDLAIDNQLSIFFRLMFHLYLQLIYNV